MNGNRILIADDETHILNVLSIKLRNAGFEVIAAEDGARALELARRCAPDVLITDYQMPHLSGIELCTQLRGDTATCGIPAIMLTARGFSLSQADMEAANIRCVLDKPFSPRDVLQRLRELLSCETAAAT